MEKCNIGWWSPGELASLISDAAIAPSDKARAVLSASATKLHSELECSNEHTGELAKELATGTKKIVRFAHQPNFLPYLQVAAQTVFLDVCAAALSDVIPIVFVVDHDIAEDQWLHHAKFFDVRVKGQVTTLKLDLTSKMQKTPLYLCQPPSTEAVKNSLRNTFKDEADLDAVLTLCGAGRRFASLGDFNLHGWMHFAIKSWNLPLLFVRLSDVSQHFGQEQLTLAARIAKNIGKPEEEMFWTICNSCSRRAAIGGMCCDGPVKAERLIPRVLLDELADYELYGVSGGTSYSSGRAHLRHSHRIADQMRIPTSPESCWRLWYDGLGMAALPANVSGAAKKLVAGGRSSIAAFATEEKSRNLKASLDTLFRDQGRFADMMHYDDSASEEVGGANKTS